MQVGAIENFIRYAVLLALAVIIVLAGLAAIGVVKMPGNGESAGPRSPAKTALAGTPAPLKRTPAPGPTLHPAFLDESPGKGTFQSDSLASPAPASPTPAGM